MANSFAAPETLLHLMQPFMSDTHGAGPPDDCLLHRLLSLHPSLSLPDQLVCEQRECNQTREHGIFGCGVGMLVASFDYLQTLYIGLVGVHPFPCSSYLHSLGRFAFLYSLSFWCLRLSIHSVTPLTSLCTALIVVCHSFCFALFIRKSTSHSACAIHNQTTLLSAFVQAF
jgi:hypothetical protein